VAVLVAILYASVIVLTGLALLVSSSGTKAAVMFGNGSSATVSGSFDGTVVGTWDGETAAPRKIVADAISKIKGGATSLNLHYNKIGDEGAKAIAAVLAGSSLTSLALIDPWSGILPQWWLSLIGNQIGDEGAKAIAAVLAGSSLTTLSLDGNKIGDEGANAIAAVLAGSSLTELRLYNSNIGDEGAKAIAAVLAGSSLTTLALGYNKIGDQGAKAIAAVLAGINNISVILCGYLRFV
jgi:hypothetical protein